MRVAPPSNQPWAEVRSVEEKSPAERAGLRTGDRITQVNGVKASSPSAFLDARRATRGGKPVSLVVQRSNDELRLTFTPRPMALEADPALRIDYGAVTTPAGYRQRTLITHPVQATGKLPSLLLIPWLSCAPVEVLNRTPSGMDRLLAGILRESGFLTLRVEKPGVGDSEGPACSQTDLATEMAGERAALEQLKAHPSFDPDRLFILGMSLGGGRAPLAGQGENVRGYVSIVGVVKTWFEHMMAVERRRLTLSGKSPAEVNEAMRGFAELYTEYLVRGKTPGEVIRANPSLRPLWEDEPAHQYGRPALFYTQVQALNLESAWQKVKVPTLIVAGEYDWIMSQDDYERMAALVNANVPGGATLLRWPRASHELEQFPSREAAFKEEGGTFDDALINHVVRWLKSHAAS
jgi:pimeloyl-ACP methyl ester carboxylesterase